MVLGKKPRVNDPQFHSDEYIALAKECGITLEEEDFELDDGELSDEDLENVSGGMGNYRRVIIDGRKWEREQKARRAQEASGQGAETTGDQN